MRIIIKFLLTLLMILAIVWLGLWWYAEGRMEAGFTAWADQLTTQGWKIAYRSDTRGKSPIAATLTLTGLTLSAPLADGGSAATISLPSLTLRIEALDPLRLHTDLPAKILVDIGGDVAAAITFTSITATEQLDPHVLFNHGAYPYRSGDFAASGVDILASQGSLLVLHFDSIASHYAINPAAGSKDMALTSTESVDGMALSPLMTRLLSIPFGGKIAHLALGVSLSGPIPPDLSGAASKLKAVPKDLAAQQKIIIPLVHEWAAAGGNGNFALNSAIGPASLAADATIGFDAGQQPQGKANLTADHLDAFSAAITNAYPGTADIIAQIEAQLSPYLTASNQSGQTLAMHVVYGNGQASINGQNTGALPRLDWTALANPPPPAPDSPSLNP